MLVTPDMDGEYYIVGRCVIPCAFLGKSAKHTFIWERSGSVVEFLTRDRGAAGSSTTGVTALWSLTKHIYPSLVHVNPNSTVPV